MQLKTNSTRQLFSSMWTAHLPTVSHVQGDDVPTSLTYSSPRPSTRDIHPEKGHGTSNNQSPHNHVHEYGQTDICENITFQQIHQQIC